MTFETDDGMILFSECAKEHFVQESEYAKRMSVRMNALRVNVSTQMRNARHANDLPNDWWRLFDTFDHIFAANVGVANCSDGSLEEKELTEIFDEDLRKPNVDVRKFFWGVSEIIREVFWLK